MKVRNAIYIVAGMIGLSSCEDVSTPQFDPVKDAFVQSTVASRVMVGTDNSVASIPLELVALPSAQATVKFEFVDSEYAHKAELGKHFQIVDQDGNPIDSKSVTFGSADNKAAIYLKPLNAADNNGETYQTDLVLSETEGCNLGAKHSVSIVVVYNQDLAPLLGSFTCTASGNPYQEDGYTQTWTVQILPSGDDLNTLSIQNLLGTGAAEKAVVGRITNGNYNQISVDFGQELLSGYKFATATYDGTTPWTFSTVGRMVLSKSGNRLNTSLSGMNFYCGAALDDDNKPASSNPWMSSQSWVWQSLSLSKQ